MSSNIFLFLLLLLCHWFKVQASHFSLPHGIQPCSSPPSLMPSVKPELRMTPFLVNLSLIDFGPYLSYRTRSCCAHQRASWPLL